MAVNTLSTGLIVFKISKVFGEVKATVDQILGRTCKSPLRRVLFVIIESGMVLFLIQLARLVVTFLMIIKHEGYIFAMITGIHPMINVSIRSVISTRYFTIVIMGPGFRI